MNASQKKFVYVILGSALVGMFLSAVLTSHHVNPAGDSAVVDAVCGTDSSKGCGVVNTSPLSEVLGVPVALWGFFFYGFVFVLALFFYLTSEKAMLQTTLLLSAVALLADLMLFLYSIVQLDTVCNLCLLSYAATLGALVGAYLCLKEIKKEEKDVGMIPDFSALGSQGRGMTLGMALALVLVLASGSLVYARAQANAASATDKVSSEDPNALIGKALRAFAKKYRETEAVDINLDGVPSKGASDKAAALIIVEYADFMCPHCRITGLQLDKIMKRCPNLIQVRYKHYPLDRNCNQSMRRQLHDGACKLSQASHCADKQGKFWKMHDAIFAEQGNMRQRATDDQINGIAKTARLNMGKFKKCMSSEASREYVRGHLEEADRLKITGTPTVYVNGRKIRPVEYFMDILAEQEAKAKFGGSPRCKP